MDFQNEVYDIGALIVFAMVLSSEWKGGRYQSFAPNVQSTKNRRVTCGKRLCLLLDLA